MALSARIEAPGRRSSLEAETIDRAKARELADLYLMDHVGDLTMAGHENKVDGRWRFPIVLSNVRQGALGEIGIIEVEADTGDIRLSASYEELLANAKRLTRGSA
jgi:hypothetical protein